MNVWLATGGTRRFYGKLFEGSRDFLSPILPAFSRKGFRGRSAVTYVERKLKSKIKLLAWRASKPAGCRCEDIEMDLNDPWKFSSFSFTQNWNIPSESRGFICK